MNEAVEVIAGAGPILITCEHATQRMPPGWSWPDEDRWLMDSHWAYDIGARDIVLELRRALGATAVLSRYSRLLIDPNRIEDSPTLFRTRAEGRPVHLNTALLDDAERARRIEHLLRPYHAGLDMAVRESRAPTLLAIHSFTEVYEGQPRELEVGVLFDRDEGLATRVAEALARKHLEVALNEPYSGKNGLMYSVDRHARAHSREAVELEVRQDLAADPAFRATFVEWLAEIFG